MGRLCFILIAITSLCAPAAGLAAPPAGPLKNGVSRPGAPMAQRADAHRDGAAALGRGTRPKIQRPEFTPLGEKLRMAGYRTEEIQDIISGRRTMGEINANIQRRLLGLPPLPPRTPSAAGPRQAAGVMAAARPYITAVKQAARRHGVSAPLILAVIQAESAFQARAVSRKGAVGLMQLMPETAAALGIHNPYNPWENIAGGTRYLSHCLSRFGDTALALAAYNAGPHRVSAYGGIPPWAETRRYVQRVLTYERYFRHRVGRL